MSANLLAALLLINPLGAGSEPSSLSGLTPEASTPSKDVSRPLKVRYEVTVLPASESIFVRGLIEAAAPDISGWIAGASGLPSATLLSPRAGSGQDFGYAISLAANSVSNAPDAELSTDGFRGWGSGFILVPVLGGQEPDVIEICLTAPATWRVATSLGLDACVAASGVDEAFGTLLFAGQIDVHRFSVSSASVTLAVATGHPLPAVDLQQALRRIVAVTESYLDRPPPEEIFVGVDWIPGDQRSLTPGYNISSGHRSSTVLIDRVSTVHGLTYWGTWAHEYLHSWMPRAFGNSSATRENLGSIFIEGFTDYMAYQIAFRAGLYDQTGYLNALTQFHSEYLEAFAQARPEDAEFIRYRHGMMAAWALDLEILRATNVRSDFRRVITLLLDRHAGGAGLTQEAVRQAFLEVGGREVAVLYDRLASPSTIIDLKQHFARTGLRLQEAEEGGERILLSPRGSRERDFSARWLNQPAPMGEGATFQTELEARRRWK